MASKYDTSLVTVLAIVTSRMRQCPMSLVSCTLHIFLFSILFACGVFLAATFFFPFLRVNHALFLGNETRSERLVLNQYLLQKFSASPLSSCTLKITQNTHLVCSPSIYLYHESPGSLKHWLYSGPDSCVVGPLHLSGGLLRTRLCGIDYFALQ